MTTLLLGAFAASLAGSLHCVGMCGGFVALYSADLSAKEAWKTHVAYHAGRLLTYVALGLVMGGIGSGLDRAGTWVGFQRLAVWLSGGLLIVWGLVMIAQNAGIWTLESRLPLPFQRLLQRAHRSLRERSPLGRAWLLGLLTTALPCGWLYAWALTAASTGSPWLGAWVMLAFWLGNVPALLGLGWSLRSLGQRFRQALPHLSAALMILLGVIALSHRAQITPHLLTQPPPKDSSPTSPASKLPPPTRPSCH